jgi:hypothetical protein
MSEYPRYAEWVERLNQSDGVLFAVFVFSLFAIGGLMVVRWKLPRLLPRVRVLIHLGFFVVTATLALWLAR